MQPLYYIAKMDIKHLATEALEKTVQVLPEGNQLRKDMIREILSRQKAALKKEATESISKGFEYKLGLIADLLEKGGRPAVEGEERIFGGNVMKKTAGKWVYVRRAQGTSKPAANDSNDSNATNTKSSFDRGEAHHSEQVSFHTKEKDMHQDIAKYIEKRHGSHGSDQVKHHTELAKQHDQKLQNLANIKAAGGLMSVNHLKVGDKFIATSRYPEGKQVSIKITKVDKDYVQYMTDEGHTASLDRKTGRGGGGEGSALYVQDFSKWKPADSSKKSQYEGMPADKFLKEMGIDNVSMTVYQGKRSTIFDRETRNVADVADKIKALVEKNGKPTKVTYQKVDTSGSREVSDAMYAEHDYSYHKGTSVTLHWGDKQHTL